MGSDAADSARISDAIARIVPALESFNRFDGPDLAAVESKRWLEVIDVDVPQLGEGLDAVVDALANSLIPFGLRMGAPGFSGWITGQPTTAPAVAALSQSIAGPQRFFFHPFNILEQVGLRWVAQMLGLDEGVQGVFTSGGSVASLVGLASARQRAFERLGVDTSATGIPADKKWAIYASEEAHHIITRAAAVIGLGRRCVVPIECDDKGSMRMDSLQEALERDAADGVIPIAIVATTGTVNTGAVDPIPQIADLAAQRDIWLHIDGAYGLFARLDDSVAPLFEGVERADSHAVDPHKWMATAMGCGIAFVRDGDLLERTFTLEPAAYLEGAVGESLDDIQSPWDVFGGDHHHLSVEQSAPPRGVQVWAVLKEIGVEGMRARVKRHMGFARHVASRAREEANLELLDEPTLSICCFRYVREGLKEKQLGSLNEKIIKRLHREGLVPSSTVVRGKYAIRPCFINPRTEQSEVDGLVDAVLRIGDSLRV